MGHRVQFVFDRQDSKHVVEVNVTETPRKGDVFLFHEFADSDEEPWEVAAVFKDVWPGALEADQDNAPPLSSKGLPLYYSDSIMVVLRQYGE